MTQKLNQPVATPHTGCTCHTTDEHTRHAAHADATTPGEAGSCCTTTPTQPTDLPLSLPNAHTPASSSATHAETLQLVGLDCADCAATLERGIRTLPGMQRVSANFANAKMSVEYDTAHTGHAQIVRRVEELGYGVAEPASSRQISQDTNSQLVFTIAGMDCADCAATIERQVAGIARVRNASVNLIAARLVIEAERPDARLGRTIEDVVRDAGYRATPVTATEGAAPRETFWQRHATLLPTVAATILWVLAFALGFIGVSILPDVLYGAAIAIGGYRIARRGYFALVRGRTVGIDLLMTIAVVGAMLIGEWSEGAAVVVLFSIGAALESLTMDKARNAIRSLMDLSPREATLVTPTGEQRIGVEALRPGDVIVIRPGELVAADGTVVGGATTINQAAITGESIPVAKESGDSVFAGTINERGYVEVEVTRPAQDTTLAKIIQLVEEAQGTRAPSQRFVDEFARYYTPAIMLMAVLVAALPPLFGEPFLPWLYKALVLLVIACPCALVISTPVSIVAGIARASRTGVLIKGGAHLEAIGAIRTIAFDKTGTLTAGKPEVTDIVPLTDEPADEVLRLMAAVESRSEHPLAGAILRAAGERGLMLEHPRDFEALPGRGARAIVGDQRITVGGLRLFPDIAAAITAQVATLRQQGKTVLLVGREDQPIGIIAVTDQVRPGAEQAVQGLRAAGVQSVVMLTGDNEVTAAAVAQRLGISEVRANLLPEDKTAAIKDLLAQHGRVAMVGDGVNDAPALASATVGITMGVAGSDTALEVADIALMGDDLGKLPFLMRLSRAALGTIRANIAFSLVVKVVFLALTLVGLSNLWLAILADTGAALIVIVNSMRLLGYTHAPKDVQT